MTGGFFQDLYDEYKQEFVIVNKTLEDDGYGGYDTAWKDGIKILAAIDQSQTNEARIAAQLGAAEKYTIITSKELNLSQHTVIKRVKDGKFFRITSNGGEIKTPKSSTLDMNVVYAENFTIPKDDVYIPEDDVHG